MGIVTYYLVHSYWLTSRLVLEPGKVGYKKLLFTPFVLALKRRLPQCG